MAEHFCETILAHRKAALAAPQFSMRLDHVFIGVPCTVEDDRAIHRMIVGRIEAREPLRSAMLADIIVAGQ
jgi:hypothetical protein